jgi:hypothetical protein
VYLALLLLLCSLRCGVAQEMQPVSLPKEFVSSRFIVTIDGHSADVMHAAANYYDVNFVMASPVKVSVTAPSADYWDRGVEVQPWRENIRPSRNGATIQFQLDHPAKLSISRPGDHFGGAEMLFLFANPPQAAPNTAGTSGVRYYGPGVHHGSIDTKSGDRIYLAPGAVIVGGINFWKVHDVRVSGLGTVLYDGPQNPNDDEGWKNRKSWHCITMRDARQIDVSGITCVVRSRTWMIQMKDSHFVTFDNIKVIGGSSSNANQDGIDWLGGGDTLVRNVFIRAADDTLAIQGNWDGYEPSSMTKPGHEVKNITVEDSVLSTSISNILRVGWPTKTFNSSNLTLHNIDVIHMGSGGCGIPFALFEIWGIPDAKGLHRHYLFDDVRLEDWYSLTQLQQQAPGIEDVVFEKIWSPESPAMVGSTLMGNVTGVRFDQVKVGNTTLAEASQIPLELSEGAAKPEISAIGIPHAVITQPVQGSVKGTPIVFDASSSTGAGDTPEHYTWFFGDGTTGQGRTAQHTFSDSEGTLLDGSGRFRVMLRVSNDAGQTDWSAVQIVIPSRILPAFTLPLGRILQSDVVATMHTSSTQSLPNASSSQGAATTLLPTIRAPSQSAESYTLDGYLNVPVDGGYTFHLLGRDADALTLDGVQVTSSPAPWPQVCGLAGNAVQQATGSIGLAAGLHHIHVTATHTASDDPLRLLWEGPTVPLSTVRPQVLFHDALTEAPKP